MTSPVSLSVENGIAIIQIDNPPVNALSAAVRQGLSAAIQKAGQDEAVKSVVIIGGGRTFPAGADISEFGKPPVEPHLPDVINLIEDCPKPVVAALHGTALGGGFEIALGSHYRIAASGAKVGLPEVNLGILPGAGGTQRMPRLTGVKAAAELMTKGTPIGAKQALSIGAIDRISETDLRADAVAFAGELTVVRRTRDAAAGVSDKEASLADLTALREMLKKRARGQLAPFKILDCIEFALDNDFYEGLKFERDAFYECLTSDQSKGMIHVFFAERASAKAPEAGRAKPRPIHQIGVVGGGTMGAGITVSALNAGLPVTMVERDAASIERGQQNVEKVYDLMIAKGRMTKAQKANVMSLYTPSSSYSDLAQVDLVIEAVFEQMDVKQAVFVELDKVIKQGAVLASNTSYLNIDQIASATTRPNDVIGLHFFSPANIMKLLEIVIPSKADDDVVATGFALAKKLGKIPVRAGNCDGFIGNRILSKYGTVAGHIVEDGASPYDVDKAVLEFGYPMGIHAMFDLAGLDIGWDNRKKDADKRDPNARYVEIADRICENGWFGQKTGRGFYLYPDGARLGTASDDVIAIISKERAKKNITPRTVDSTQILRRYMAAMVNEAADVLHEGIALKPSDIDVTAIYGYGFPRYRGGPMKYADMYGLDKMLADIREFEKEDPLFWKPSPLLIKLVEKGENFDSLNRKA